MRPTHSSHAQLSTPATRETPASAAQSIPTTHFKPHFVVGGGDCLFHALCMGSTNQPAVPVSMEHIMSLRQDAANYVAEHRAALISHPSLGGEAGVNALYGLLITQGQWNENAGDLVPPILARVLGREIRILEPTQHGDSYDANENRIFKPQDADTGLPPAKPDTGQPPMYLAHINNAHYEYLEPRDPQTDATSESIIMDPVEYPSDASSLGNTSASRWLDLLLDEKKNNPTDDDGHLPSLQGSSFGRVSSLSSLESYSSRAFLEKFTAEEKNSPTEVIGQPPQKRPRHAERRREQESRVVKGSTHPLMGRRQVEAQSARNEIKKTFTEAANNRPFDALTEEEQTAEVTRISQETGYRTSGIRTTLSGGGNKQVRTQAARNEIMAAFTEAAHNRSSFHELTSIEQETEVTRISRQTGYRPSGVRTTLNDQGKKFIITPSARNEITKAFTDKNSRSFNSLTKDEQTAEVTRISRQTEYNPSAVQTTLNGSGNKKAAKKAANIDITKTFTDANNRPFSTLTQNEQAAEVRRISRKTGYIPSAVRATLNSRGKIQIRTQTAGIEVKKAFIQMANNRPFETLTKDQQAAQVTLVSRKTGYNPSAVQTTLTGGGTKPVATQAARNEITKLFTETANNRPFDALIQKERDAEVTRISRKTGYSLSGVRTTLNGEGNKQVRTQGARTQITKLFIEANEHPFETLTEKRQAEEVTRISRKTGYRPSGVLTTLTGEGNKQVRTQAARTQITKLFTEANEHPFETLTEEKQAAEVMRISRETGYHPSGVQTTLTGGGTEQIGTQAARNKVTKAFTTANDRPFKVLTQDQKTIEVMRISRETGYNPSAVQTTLTGGGNKYVRTKMARREITTAFTEANNRTFDALTPEEQAAEVVRISRKTGYNPSGVRTTLIERASARPK